MQDFNSVLLLCRNFSLNAAENTYDPDFLLSLLTTQRMSGESANENLLQEFPEIFSVAPFPLYAEVPLSDDEQKALSLQSFNSHKRISMDRAKNMNSASSASANGPNAYHHAGTGKQYSTGHAGSAGGNYLPTSKRGSHPHQAMSAKGFRDDIRSGSSLGGPLSSKSMDRTDFSVPYSHPHAVAHSHRTADDIWCDASQNQVGSFDEHGVFRSSAPFSEEKNAFTASKESSAPVSSKPIFERLRENQSSAVHSLHHNQVSEHAKGFSVENSNVLPQHSVIPAVSQSFAGVAARAPPSSDSQVDNRWLYRDPSGNIQGPFSPKEMFDWFQLGYFPPTLPIKRVRDPGFEPLGQIIQRLGTIPFNPSVPPTPSVFHSSHPTQSPNVAPIVGSKFAVVQPHYEGNFVGSLPVHTQAKSSPSSAAMNSSWGSAMSSEHTNSAASSIELPKIDINSIFQASASQNAVADNVSANQATVHLAVSSNAPVDTKALESMLLKELNISKQSSTSDHSASSSVPKITWNNSKVVPTVETPSIDRIQQEESTKKKLDDHSMPSNPITGLKASPIISSNCGSTWNVPSKGSVAVKSLEQIEKEEACSTESSKVKQNNHSSGSIFKPLSQIIQTQSVTSKGPISFKSLIENASSSVVSGSQSSAPASQSGAKGGAINHSQANEILNASTKKISNPHSQTTNLNSKSSVSNSSHSYQQNQSLKPPSELVDWCRKELRNFDGIDVPTFVSLLLDLSSAMEMKLYIEDVIGHSGKASLFASEFVKRAKSYVDGLITEEDEYVVVTKKKTKKGN